jgi:hypothetical protein
MHQGFNRVILAGVCWILVGHCYQCFRGFSRVGWRGTREREGRRKKESKGFWPGRGSVLETENDAVDLSGSSEYVNT